MNVLLNITIYQNQVGSFAFFNTADLFITAKVFGMGKPREYFEAQAGAQGAPKVQF